MDVFELRNHLIDDYASYVSSFLHIRDADIRKHVEKEIEEGLLWPDPLIQLNPSFSPGSTIDQLVDKGVLHAECRRIFQKKNTPKASGDPLRLHKHQEDAVRIARGGRNYVLTTGTGSGKSLAYIIPIVDHVLRHGSGKGIQAIIVYPMNALANSQLGELEKFICYGYPDLKGPVTFERYTGQESDEEKRRIMADPPDILLTNYVMLELILTRPQERTTLVRAAKGLRFLVLDELHTYRGRQGADVAMLVRRVREALNANRMQCIGTSATLAGSGTLEEQQSEVAEVASQIFGATVQPEHVVGETLQRATPEWDLSDPGFVDQLTKSLLNSRRGRELNYRDFIRDPMSIWIESTFGVAGEPGTGRLMRAEPRSVIGPGGAAEELSHLTGQPYERCVQALHGWLLAGYEAEPNPDTSKLAFAFRLHQFISRGDTVYASLEPESDRYITVHGQQFVPGDRKKILLPLVFCRECGQEYYSVQMSRGAEDGLRSFVPRDLSDRSDDESEQAGFLYFNTSNPWPRETEALLDRVPEEWVEEHKGVRRIRSDRKKNLPREVFVGLDGQEVDTGLAIHFIDAPFRFCLNCGISYDFSQRSDFSKLTSFGSEGRSKATTILALSAVRNLREDESLVQKARKLLSFTDNRQDASLQAGHFNDFIEVALLRGALFKAAFAAGDGGLSHDELTQRVFEALDLPIELYGNDPEVRFQARADTDKAFRDVLGYRLYRDLQRGWRVTSPNLEQCGLLQMEYASLAELCEAEDVWGEAHEILVVASPQTRMTIATVLLDYMRRELAIKVDYLDTLYQERVQQRSSQWLTAPWAIDENEKMIVASVLFPRSVRPGDYRGNLFLSARGGYGRFLRRPATFPENPNKISLKDTEVVIRQLLEALQVAGLVSVVQEAKNDDQVPGYQLQASAMTWRAGDGTRSYHDLIRVPNLPEDGGRTNEFFVEFYRTVAGDLQGIEAREHTAQVSYEERQDREERFRIAHLPVLFCSPTMELGVDISELNVVNMRNIPPTPANYAQRSGRAGRSGQPALVFSYCSTGSSHDQYFFKHPGLMVSGAVTPPRLDLANQDLIRAHVQAIWLAEIGLDLGKSLKDLLDLSGEAPTLELLQVVKDGIAAQAPREKGRARARRVLDTIQTDLQGADWYSDGWLDEVLGQVALRFDQACDRWRGLYRAAMRQREQQHRIIQDVSRKQEDKNQAKRLRREAESQLELLTDAKNIAQSDFYSYRYFASEGFLPGYNFPRLPLSAYIPARRLKKSNDEYLSRPRFLAISEFGPRAIIYHEGSSYVINKVILPVSEDDDEVTTGQAKQCPSCGYLHPVVEGDGQDLCDRCKTPLDLPIRDLFRLQNVSTRRRDRISSDEEERLRRGYEIRTGVRFTEHGGRASFKAAALERDGETLLKLTYGDAAQLWRINLGWRRRANKNQFGFVLDVERGYWAKSDEEAEEDSGDPMSPKTRRVIPYVEDHRNCLILEPGVSLESEVMASLQAALKNAIQVVYQLEDSELAAEPLPSPDDRRTILFYEATEGGAGVLRRLADDPEAFGLVARQALALCHFDPESGEDLRRGPRAREDCEAACYDCLMSYANQMDHRMLDRQLLPDLLLQYAGAQVRSGPAMTPRAEHLERLMNLAGSELERQWLRYLDERNYRLPSEAQLLIPECGTRPDFFYQDHLVAVYIDGPHHAYPERAARDREQTDALMDLGYTVVRFGLAEDWESVLAAYPNVFGTNSGG